MPHLFYTRGRLAVVLALSLSGIAWALNAADDSLSDLRSAAAEEFAAGNYRDAWEVYSELALDDRNSGNELSRDFDQAVQCLRQLQRHHEIDDFRERVIEAQSDDWRLLQQAAHSLIHGEHSGFIVAGEFSRGGQRGGGQWSHATERDRAEALQLMERARLLIADETEKNDVASFYLNFANHLMFSRSGGAAWELQDLTDLQDPENLPDYQVGYYGWGGSGAGKGAPVDENGDPVFFHRPETWEDAANDGERWRWCLTMVVEYGPHNADAMDWQFAQFLRSQFGVQTMRQWGIILPRHGGAGEADDVDESGPYALHSLGEDETIAKLATGIRRLTLPDEFNFIRIFQRLAENEADYAESALAQLAQIFSDRQQYPRAAEYWRESIDRFRDQNNSKQQQLDQIVGNWGRFENVQTQDAGSGATVEYRFRNGSQLHLEAVEIRIDTLLEDIQKYLESAPNQIDWNQMQIDNIGYRLVEQQQEKYLGEKVAEWDVELQPRPQHFDRRITLTTPLQQAGAYFVTARMDDGNLSRVILWVDDTAIVKKQLDGKAFYFVADATTGEPVEGANVEFFGWRQERVPNTRNRYRVVTTNFAEFTDEEGRIIPDVELLDEQYQWIAIARSDNGRFAHLGFNRVWYGLYQNREYNQNKVFVITDRPVYRPDQQVQFKFWLRHAHYDQDDVSDFANQEFTVKINDPQGTEVFSQQYTSDEFGGVAGEYALPEDAALGNYTIYLEHYGGSNFRVEEYKKPEYSVTVEAPEEPVMLGEKITATIRADYYFGAPVTEATVSFKVHRTSREAHWYPYRPWDWLYGNGYWWFAADYDWYPGWGEWGCRAPYPIWWGWSPDPPELVIDQEVQIGLDGTVEVEIDTALAKELHGDTDHEYRITAEVVDASRRTIVGSGSVLVARAPFQVFGWTDRGFYRIDDTINAQFQARTVDGNGVAGEGTLRLLNITYDEDGEPVENLAQEWDLNTDAEGHAAQEIKASEAGQYRLSYTVTDAEGHSIEGGYVFVIRGAEFDGSEFRFNDLELIADKSEYAPGESVQLMVNTNRLNSTVLLFIRPADNIYLPPEVLHLDGKSTVHEIPILQRDMPNFHVEALTIADGKVHTVVREIIVPPEQRVLDVALEPSAEQYQPGEEATVRVKLTDIEGEPFSGSVVMSIYDRAVEYISGGSNVPEIRSHFWKWRRSHYPRTEHNLSRWSYNLIKSGETGMGNLGVFGDLVAEFEQLGQDEERDGARPGNQQRGQAFAGGQTMRQAAEGNAEMATMYEPGAADDDAGGAAGGGDLVEPTVRTQFADTAYWKGDITTDDDGEAEITLNMPENLTGWKVRAWALGHGTRVGEGTTEVVTFKNLMIRLQAPRFFVEKDEVVLSAVVHNYLESAKDAQVQLELGGGTLEPMGELAQTVSIPAGGEARVDWRVRVVGEGEAVVTMSALTDEESDAMQIKFPVFVHGMLKTDSYSGIVRANEDVGTINVTVPAERRPEQTRLEIRYSPTLAGAMVDALPYLAEYPYGCTEQTLNRFLPTVITQNILLRMGLDLEDIRDKQTNLNAQEIGDDPERAAQWQRWDRNPVFDEEEVARMVKQGVRDLTAMQLSDGGWGWFSGWGEHSYPHTTATVIHGLQVAEQNGVALVPGVIDRGVEWLNQYQNRQVALLQEWERTERKGKSQCSNVDALLFMVLVDAAHVDAEMQRFLYRDRNDLTLYSQSIFGVALDTIGADEQRDMVIRNIDQFVVYDEENQTAYIDLPNQAYWWYWYGDTIEANAWYLKLLTRTDPQDPKAAGLVKYLLNNRKHATYWNSTRDTAVCIEALAEYLVESGEAEPNAIVEVWVDGGLKQSVEITPEVLFTFDNSFVIEGEELASGPHQIEIRKKPLEGDETSTPIYYNAYLTNFTLEDFITSAGLEIKVWRRYYKLVQREDATDVVQGSSGQVIDQAADKYDRVELTNLATIQSGDLIEIELEIESKNDYEYVVFEDFKPAGLEPVDLRSGYTSGGLGAYVEFRDEKVAFFMRRLAQGRHSVSYRMRAEIPGRFSALPTRAWAMYAPELRGNSDEIKLNVEDIQH